LVVVCCVLVWPGLLHPPFCPSLCTRVEGTPLVEITALVLVLMPGAPCGTSTLWY
jgi:hypothetical protein